MDLSINNLFRLLPPFKDAKRSEFQRALLARFPDCEGAVEYVDRVLDRQINKANGLLAFDGLLFTALSVVSASVNPIPISIRIGCALALIAALPLILLLVVDFGKISDYVKPCTDFTAKCLTIYYRTYAIILSVLLSVAAAGVSLWRLW